MKSRRIASWLIVSAGGQVSVGMGRVGVGRCWARPEFGEQESEELAVERIPWASRARGHEDCRVG